MTTGGGTIAYHQERSRHFLSLVDDELARGELEKASNKVWGAAAHAIKAVAEIRGWEHHAHALLPEAIQRLIRDEGAPPHLWSQYMMASAYHQGFYAWPPPADAIRYGRDIISEFIATLESLSRVPSLSSRGAKRRGDLTELSDDPSGDEIATLRSQ